MTHQTETKSPQPVAEAESLVGVASTDLFAERCRRWNFEATDSDILVCYDHHDKGQKCEYQRMTPDKAVELIEGLRSEALKFRPANKLL